MFMQHIRILSEHLRQFRKRISERIVQLGGFVSGDKMKARAIAVAKGVSGVKQVDDALFVKPE